MTSIAILGAGVMSSAFSLPAADNGHAVRLIGSPLDSAIIGQLRQDQTHPGLRAPLHDRTEYFLAGELDQALAAPLDLIVVGVSSAGIEWALDALKSRMTDCAVIMLTKGLDIGERRIAAYPERFGRELGVPVGAIGGPCIAGELAVRRDTSVMVGFNERALADRWAKTLSCPYYHVRATDDVVGLELCAGFKNFMALGIGAAQGWLDCHDDAVNDARAHNLAAGLFNQAVCELQILNAAFGGCDGTVFGLPGVGDLFVTVQGGRNARMGRLLGAGWTYRKAKAERMAKDTVEGAQVARYVGSTLRDAMTHGTLDASRLPLTNAILDAVVDDHPFQIAWSSFHHESGST